MTKIDGRGINTDFFKDIFDQIDKTVQDAFGRLNKNSSGVLDELNKIQSDIILQFQQILLDVVIQNTISGAVDINLDNISLLKGLIRKIDQPSTVILTFTGDTEGFLIPMGTLVENKDTQEQFQTNYDVSLDDEFTAQVQASSVDIGAIEALPNTLIIIVDPPAGWESIIVTNHSSAILGFLTESDNTLRVRSEAISSVRSINLAVSLEVVLRTLNGVKNAKVYENKTMEIDIHGLPPKSYSAVLYGGIAQDIAYAVYDAKPPGIPNIGDEEFTIIVLENNTSKAVYFNYAGETLIFIKVTIIKGAEWIDDNQQIIQNSILTYFDGEQNIGNDVITDKINLPIFNDYNNNLKPIKGITKADILIGLSDPPTSSDNIPINFKNIAITNLTSIEVIPQDPAVEES